MYSFSMHLTLISHRSNIHWCLAVPVLAIIIQIQDANAVRSSAFYADLHYSEVRSIR